MLAAALIIAGLAGVFFGVWYVLHRLREDLRREFQDQIDSLYVKVRLREPVAAAWPEAAPSPAPPSGGNATPGTPSHAKQEDGTEFADCAEAADTIPPETLAILTETVSAFLGKKVEICSARLLETSAPGVAGTQAPQPGTATWSQEGRAMVQASHDLVQARIPPASVRRLSDSLRGVLFEARDHD
jgi:hypothetical protein